ncbi:MAG TPA: hypothetical protein VII92_02625 [Anaerolineae bacterium]
MNDDGFLSQVAATAARAGAKDPYYVAECARLYAYRHSIAEAIKVFKRNRPDLFKV